MTLRHCVCCTVLLACPGVAAATDLLPETAEAYNAYIVEVRERFGRQVESRAPIEEASPVTLARLRAGEIVAGPGHEDGIFNVPSGLIHHWRGRAFVPGVTLDEMVAVAQDYPHYTDTYDWVIGSGVMEHEREEWPRRDRYRLFLRIKRSARLVTGVLDLWLFVEYRYPRADLAVAVSNADCIRQVQNEGRPDERRMDVGRDSGYLWRVNTFSTYLEADGGVFVELETIGLSRRFPRMVGWLIEPIARRLGRGSAADTLRQLRSAALLHESSLARTMPTDRILTCRCDTTLVGRGRSSD